MHQVSQGFAGGFNDAIAARTSIVVYRSVTSSVSGEIATETVLPVAGGVAVIVLGERQREPVDVNGSGCPLVGQWCN